jgi:hypothetical protein
LGAVDAVLRASAFVDFFLAVRAGFRATAFRGAALRPGRVDFRRDPAAFRLAAGDVRPRVLAFAPRLVAARRRADAPLRAAAFLRACFLAISD